jgi:hypothetical protein
MFYKSGMTTKRILKANGPYEYNLVQGKMLSLMAIFPQFPALRTFVDAVVRTIPEKHRFVDAQNMLRSDVTSFRRARFAARHNDIGVKITGNYKNFRVTPTRGY